MKQIDRLGRLITGLDKRLAILISDSAFSTYPESRTTVVGPRKRPAPATMKTSSGNTSAAALTDKADQSHDDRFASTHRAIERVNLGPSPSTDRAAIETLNVGTEVQYIRENDEWLYVKTDAHGEGWVASEYLSPG